MNRAEATSSVNVLRPALGSITVVKSVRSPLSVPFWVFLWMVLVGLGLLGGTVGFRTRVEMKAALDENEALRQQVEHQSLRTQKLRREVDSLNREIRHIEDSARSYGMIKSNGIVLVVK